MLSLAFPNDSQGASLSGSVYVDINGDGAFQTGEWGVRSDVIQLFQNNLLVQQVTTNSLGQYSFTNLAAGTYTVKNTIPCYLGNMADVGQMLNASNTLLPGTSGTPNSALVQISDIVLQDGYKAINYNFGNDSYPMDLYSKHMLIFDPPSQVQKGVVTPVPEPAAIVQLLAIFGMLCGWKIFRQPRRRI